VDAKLEILNAGQCSWQCSKKKPRVLNKAVSKVLVMECALFAFKLALCLGMLAFSIRIIQDQVSFTVI